MPLRLRWILLKPVLYDTRYVIGFIATFAIPVVLVSLFPRNAEALLRYSAVAWELLGIGAVVWGILETKRRFQRNIFTPRLRAWFERLRIALGKTQTIRLEAIGGAGSLFGGSAELTANRNRNLPLEDRVKALELDFDSLRDQVARQDRQVDSELKRLAQEMKEERDRRTQAVASVETLLADVAAGGLDLEVMGLIWLVAGLLASNLSTEIANLVAR